MICSALLSTIDNHMYTVILYLSTVKLFSFGLQTARLATTKDRDSRMSIEIIQAMGISVYDIANMPFKTWREVKSTPGQIWLSFEPFLE